MSDQHSMSAGVQVPISIKLVLVTIGLIVAVVFPVAIRNSQLFESTFSKSQHDANAELSNSKAIEVESLLLNNIEKIRTITNLLLTRPTNEAEKDAQAHLLDLVFFRDLDLVNVDIYQMKAGHPELYLRQTNEAFFQEFKLSGSNIAKIREIHPFMANVFSDPEKIIVQNTTLKGGAPLYSLGVPFADENGVVSHVAVAEVRLNRLQKAFSVGGIRTLYLVDEAGSVLAHSDDKLATDDRNLADLPIVQEAMSLGNQSSKGQKRFYDPEMKEWFIGAYSKTAFGVTVITQAPERIILEPSQLVKYESFEVAGYVFSGALFLVIIFSLTLTSPIEALHEATIQVAEGNLNVKADVRTHDEVGQLARSFNFMLEGIRERDKVKNILTKFHGSSVTEDLLKNDLKLGGTKKPVTVFFSDIRDFTHFSENHTPEEVVEMLNEYFQIMVGIITSNHGIVDKFVGDAVMAIWGAPQSTGKDNFYAVKACLEMRLALAELNKARSIRGQPAIRIGMGVHSGLAISGRIGSTERMEYTVIGDTVNMASRIEASTKAFGADLLVSEAVVQELTKRYLFELAGSAHVKGKSDMLKMFKVRGTINDTGEVTQIQTPYSDYEPGAVDKVKVSA